LSLEKGISYTKYVGILKELRQKIIKIG